MTREQLNRLRDANLVLKMEGLKIGKSKWEQKRIRVLTPQLEEFFKTGWDQGAQVVLDYLKHQASGRTIVERKV
jgi:predicted peroxiredoxin